MQESGSGQALVLELSERQLRAYNSADLEVFCACYHPEVLVTSADGEVMRRGMEEFRAAYERLFTDFSEVRASVTERIALGRHSVEREQWSRRSPEGELQEGTIIVRYTEEEGLIRYAQFLFDD